MSDIFDAWNLPGADPESTEIIEVGELTCRYPTPTPELLTDTVAGLRGAGRALSGRPVAELVDVVDTAAARLLDRDDELRAEAVDRLTSTGYSRPMATNVLDGMARDWRAERLRRLLEAELGDPAVLDGFAPVGGGRRSRAYGPRLAFHIFAGNVPGVAVTSLIRALLVKTPSLGKLASRQPVLPVLFARAVAAVDPDVGRALAVTYWPGGDPVPEAVALAAADAVVVYGGDEVVTSVRERTPEGARLIVHGPRFSAGLVAGDALDAGLPAIARAVARAVALFDQHGCVSPHTVWVEAGTRGTAEDFAGALAEALRAVEEELPRGRVSAGEAAAIQQERAAAELKGHDPDGPTTRVFASPGTRWTVIYDTDPAFVPSCLNRLVRVHPVDDLGGAVDRLAPVGRFLQSVAVAAPDPRRAELAHHLASVGASRITTFERLPWPPPDWHHDGQEPLRELLRWVDLED